MKKILIFSIVLLALTAALLTLPYKSWLEGRLEAILEAKGLGNVELTVAQVGMNGAALENLSIGGETPLTLKNVALGYSLSDLRSRRLDELTVRGVSVEVRQEKGRWVVTGLENRQSEEKEKIVLPATPEELARVPFNRVKIEDSSLRIVTEAGQVSLPLSLTWRKIPEPGLAYKANGLTFSRPGLTVKAGAAALNAAVAEGGWKGAWSLEDISVEGVALPVPPLRAEGTLAAAGGNIIAEGKAASRDDLWRAEFAFDSGPKQPVVTVRRASMPWKDGRLAVENVKFLPGGKNPVKVNLQVQHVSLDELMQALTGDRVTATGTVSGVIPLLVGRDGSIAVLPGTLKAEGPGTVTMPPDLIPGDHEQVSFVREVLQNLHYTNFSIETKEGENGALGVLLALEGNNPGVLDGRPVKLNVNLTGDVLEFVRKNVILLAKPETLLKRGIE